jgi:putative sterol carrier protein
MPTSQDVAGLFTKMQERFDPAKAQNLNTTIQVDLSGDEGGLYWIRIADNQFETGSGTIESPRMTLRASAIDFYNMMNGTLNPMQAFMQGKVKVAGDTSVAMKLLPLMS